MPSNTENITLVAPRPVRLSNFSIHLPSPHRQHPLRIASTPTDTDDRVDSPLDDDALLHLDPDSKSPKASPRASPRSSLPSEALEEFLSILRPSLFPPRSPVLRPLRYPISSLHDCTLTLPSKPLSGIDNLSILPRDDSRTPVKQLSAPRAPTLRENEENDMGPETPPRFFSSGPLGTSSISFSNLSAHNDSHLCWPVYSIPHLPHTHSQSLSTSRFLRDITCPRSAGSGPLSGLSRAAFSYTERARVNLTPTLSAKATPMRH
jgi:hypothetical protein